MVAQFIINFCYLAEWTVFLITWGFWFCLKEKMHMLFEFCFQITNLVLFISFVDGDSDPDFEVRFLEIIILFRITRLFYLMSEIVQFRLIGDTFKALVRPFFTLIMSLYCVYYIYAMIGDAMFGGKNFNNDIRVLSDPNLPGNFVLMNMNDITASFYTLFALMIVNNWYVTTLMLTTGLGSIYGRWFSITFYFICVLIVLNIVVAFTIDMYGNVADLQRTKEKEAAKKE